MEKWLAIFDHFSLIDDTPVSYTHLDVYKRQVLFSAVGTPPDEDGSADLKYVLEVARTVGRNMTKHLLVVTKSTVPVGTARKVREAVSYTHLHPNFFAIVLMKDNSESGKVSSIVFIVVSIFCVPFFSLMNTNIGSIIDNRFTVPILFCTAVRR